MPHSSLQDLVLGEPGSAVRLGLERSDKMTGRTFFYEISVLREEGTGEVMLVTCKHMLRDTYTSSRAQKANQSLILALLLQRYLA